MGTIYPSCSLYLQSNSGSLFPHSVLTMTESTGFTEMLCIYGSCKLYLEEMTVLFYVNSKVNKELS